MLDVCHNRIRARLNSEICSCVPIVNARGVPGTLGCLALTLDERRVVLVTTYHVLFGGGAPHHDRVWLANGIGEKRSLRCAGQSRYGKLGVVRYRGNNVHVDCAVAELDAQIAPRNCRIVDDTAKIAPSLAPGDHVTKTGAGTGSTYGVVVDVAYSNRASIDGRWNKTPGQILVRSLTPGRVFSAEGDSGAVLRNGRGAIAGLLWGTNSQGDGIACPITPVLWVLHIRLAFLVSHRATEFLQLSK